MGFKDKLIKGAFALKKELKADAPTIEMVLGTCCIAAGAVINLYLADEIAEVTHNLKKRNEELHEIDNDPDGWEGMPETRTHFVLETAKEATIGYVKSAGPGLILQGVGIGLGWVSKETLENQKTALAIVAATKAAEFSQYRERVRADVGDEKDQEYLTGMTSRKVIETSEDGKVISEKTIVEYDGKSFVIPHSFIFDETHNEFTKSVGANLNFIEGALRTANLILDRQGYIFENEIWDAFGSQRTVTGQYAGAILEKKNEFGDIVTRHLRINPEYAAGLLNGTDPTAIILIEYDDGTPLEDDILSHRVELNLPLH